MFLITILITQLVLSEIYTGWKQLGCNSFGNFRAKTLTGLSGWDTIVDSATTASDMIIMNGGGIILQTQKRKGGYTYCGMCSIDSGSGDIIATTDECSTAFAGTIYGAIDGTYVYAKSGVGSYNYTTEVIAVNKKLETLWRFTFKRTHSGSNPVAVIPVKEDTIIVITGPGAYPESGIGYLDDSIVWSFDASEVIQRGALNGDLQPKWSMEMKRGSVLLYNNYLYFKNPENMVKVDPSSGKIEFAAPIPYDRVYSNILLSEKHKKLIYNCGLPKYSDPNRNQCALNLDNYTIGEWTNKFPGGYYCFNIALSNDEDLVYVQCKYGSSGKDYKIAALSTATGEIVAEHDYEGMVFSTPYRKMSAVVMDDGTVVVPMPSAIVIFDSKLKTQKRKIEWDERMAFYGAMAADNFKCFAYCLSAGDRLYGGEDVTCHKVCL